MRELDISIHLMLLFICFSNFSFSHSSAFQYISCYCLSSFPLFIVLLYCYFNTSHVTVYLSLPILRHLLSLISIHLMLLFIWNRMEDHKRLQNFNTSHVTVYHVFEIFSINLHIFQYISCYCLSRLVKVWKVLANSISIHLMLLFIEEQQRHWWTGRNFNTSHVTVYLFHHVIHQVLIELQYISCYCLSWLS